MIRWRSISIALCLLSALLALPVAAQAPVNDKPKTTDKKTSQKQAAGKPFPRAEELQKAITDAGNDRAALVKNLQAFLEKFPDAPERPQIYRALVEACMQFHDDACASNYAERIVSLTPEDVSMTLLAIQLLERTGDTAALGRAVTYATRVYDSVNGSPISEKSPRVSMEEWEGQKKRDKSAVLALRGRLEGRLQNTAAA